MVTIRVMGNTIMIQFLKIAARLVRPYFKKQVIGFILVMASSIMALVSPMVSQYLIDHVLGSKSYEKLYYGLGIFIGCAVLEVILGILNQMFFMIFAEKLNVEIKTKMVRKVLNATCKFHNSTTSGEIMNRVIGDSSYALGLITDFFIGVFRNILWAVAILVILFFISPVLTIVIIFFSLSVLLIFKLISKRIEELSMVLRRNDDMVFTAMNQMAGSIFDIKSNSLEELMLNRYRSILNKCLGDNLRYGKLNIIVKNINIIMSVTCLCIVYGYGAVLIIKGNMTLGQVFAYGLYFQMLLGPIYELLGLKLSVSKGRPSLFRYMEYMNLEEEVLGDVPLTLSGNIELLDVEFSYQEGIKILKGINMSIEKNKFTAVIGRSGAGKSTLVKLLSGFYQADSGKYLFGGMDISKISSKQLRNNTALVSQDISLFNVSILENIKYGNLDAKDEEVIKVCKKVRIHEKILQLPNQYNTVVSEKIDLSGGEQQRLAIARALIRKPSLMIFDEPTSALDPENEANIKRVLKDISKECTVVVISHRINTISDADKIYMIDDGRVIESGTHNELTARKGAYYSFLTEQENENDEPKRAVV